jgi:RHS repeat-associated protein
MLAVRSYVAIIGVLALCVLHSPKALAANGDCVWEGGPGNPTYPYCKAQDCLQNNGLAACENPDIVPTVPWFAADSNRYSYHGCQVAQSSMAETAAWCTASGGTWNPSSIACEGGGGSGVGDAVQMDALAGAYLGARYGSCSVSFTNETSWGAGSSEACWPVGTSEVNGVEIQATKIRNYHLTCPNDPDPPSEFDASVAILRDRTVQCAPGTMPRWLSNGVLQCIRPLEASTQCTDLKICPIIKNPVSIVSGAKIQRDVDYVGSANGVPSFARYYQSNGFFSPFTSSGFLKTVPSLWQHSYQRRFIPNPGSGWMAILHMPDGRIMLFDTTGKENLNSAGGGAATLQQLSGVGWRLKLPSDDVENYDTSGRLTSLVSRAGQTTTVAYNVAGRVSTVTGQFGHQLAFAYDAHARLATVTAPGNLVYSYGYDENLPSAALVLVTYPDSTTRQYEYSDLKLSGITDENGAEFAAYTYDDLGRVATTEHAGGVEHFSYEYASLFPYSQGALAVTDPFGYVENYDYFYAAGVYRPGRFPDNCHNCGSTRQIAHDADGNPQYRWLRTGDTGSRTDFTYDSGRNLEVSRTEGLTDNGNFTSAMRTIATDWHPTFQLPTLITEAQRATAFTHDANGNVLTKTVTDTTVTPNVSRTWTYTYDSYGHVLTENGPRTDVTDVTTYAYYSCSTGSQCGQVHTATNALSQVTTYNTYNAHGQPLTITDPNGVVTTLTYDTRQRLTSRQVGSEATTFQYWPTGLLKKVILPDSSFLLYTYDNAHRLTRIDDTSGNYIAYTLDALGNRTAENVYDPSSVLARTRTRVFDSLNRLSEDVAAAGTSNVTTTYDYNYFNLGEQVANISAPLGRNTAQSYDQLNRLIQITDPASGVTQFAYDAEDNLTSVTDPRSLVTSYTYTGFGDLKTQVSPDTGTTTNTYDSGGNLKTSTDARNAITTYTYDALNRATSAAFKIGATTDQTITYTYDSGTNGKGRLTGASDANHSLTWTYDAQGRVTSKGQTIGAVTKSVGYGYSSGRLATITYPSGQNMTYGYNGNNQVTSVTVGATTVLSSVTYRPFGPASGWTWGNSTTASRTYDTDGKLSQFNSGGLKTYAYDDAFRITGITDTVTGANSYTYGYDSLDRITSASKTGTTYGWTYDANGNRLSQTGTSATTFTISGTSNRISSSTGALARTYSYDAAGDTTGYTFATAAYNNRGRMKTLTKSGTTATYVYSALGQRIKQSGGTPGTVLYMYDEAGHLLGEYTSTGALVQETVWLGDIPVATLRPNGASVSIYYVHSDHLNTPIRVTRPSDNKIMWTWYASPFGTDAPNENPASGGTFKYNVRFAGQLYDSHAGLHYNYFRDGYDPATGRYTQSDPIGLKGGVNTYAYTFSSPLQFADPFGLDVYRGPGHYYSDIPPTSGCERATFSGGYITGWGPCASGYTAPQPRREEQASSCPVDRPDQYDWQDALWDAFGPDWTWLVPELKLASLIPFLKLRRIHSGETITSGVGKHSYDYWSRQSTDDIIKSLRPGSNNPLVAAPNGAIFDGNTRTYILERRGIDINSLPRVSRP